MVHISSTTRVSGAALPRQALSSSFMDRLLTALQGVAFDAIALAAIPFSLAQLMNTREFRNIQYRHLYGQYPLDAAADDAPHLAFYCHNMGELRAAIPLISAARERHPDWQLTVLTDNSEPYRTIHRLLPEVTRTLFVPLNTPLCVRAALRRLRPDALAVVEHDWRLHLMTQANHLGIVTALVGGEWNPRERKRHKSNSLLRALSNATDLIAMRTEGDKEALVARGISPRMMRIAGNLRFDISQNSRSLNDQRLIDLLERWRLEGPIFLAGSTYAEEEAAVLEALLAARGRFPNLRAVIASRRPERAGEVVSAARERGLRTLLRSAIDGGDSGADVLVVDTMGELFGLYPFCDVAYVGGTLTDHGGGHNLIEAAVHGKPVLHGPSAYANGEMVEALEEARLDLTVKSAVEITRKLVEYLDNPDMRLDVGAKCRAAANLQGASERCLVWLEELIEIRRGMNICLSPTG